jgi:GxxExxY protein
MFDIGYASWLDRRLVGRSDDTYEEMTMEDVEALAAIAVDCGLRLHRQLGPGLVESVYETLLAVSIARAGVGVERQVSISINVDGLVFKDAFRADLIIGDAVLIEIKSVEALASVHSKQLLTYLRLRNSKLGLLMNFGGATFKEGLKRVVNEYRAPYPGARTVS